MSGPAGDGTSPRSGRGGTVLICSDRTEICEALSRAFEALDAPTVIAACRDEWPEEPPGLVVLDLFDPERPVRDACLEFGDEADLWALVDQSSADRLITALAAGCSEYLFFPINPRELRLRWLKRLERIEGVSDSEPGAGLSGRLELAFPSEVSYVGRAVEEVVRSCRRLAIPGSRADLNLRVAVGEAVANAILYGNREDPSKRVTIRARFEKGRIRVTVADEGTGFDPSSVPDPTLPGNRERSHGRGLYLLRTLMDEVRFNEVGNEVTMMLGG